MNSFAETKAIGKDVETQGMINAHFRDGAVVVEYLPSIGEEMREQTPLTEFSTAKPLTQFRELGENFKGLSFRAMSPVEKMLLCPMYCPTAESDQPLNMSEIYLLDSGGHYLDGTTDVTRTIFFGKPKDEIKNDFTSVLKGMIRLRTAIFPLEESRK
ncbi:unnamed protein product [Allacma fusca]|uniref:Peptidase M24 domain-containing protein n=1 Tax=Allacma fusca TaxID=39272 RepID=A0A8J2KPL2_9HEXA|nr:unnamed protein product [Allacma fusca]